MTYKRKNPPFEAKRENIEWKGYPDLKSEGVSWLIDNLLPAKSLICLYGRRGEGKTFLALDMACSIATGIPWCGKPVSSGKAPADPTNDPREADEGTVEPGRVAYILAERLGGLRRRMIGWLMHSQKTAEAGNELFKSKKDGRQQFNAASKRYEIDNPEQCAELIEDLKALAPISLLVLDPLVYFMGGSENETRAMQLLVDGLRHISEKYECSVLAVHHEGKKRRNIDLGARGSSALEAGFDTVLHLGAGHIGTHILSITKQREAEAHLPIHLHFKEMKMDEKDFGKFPEVISAPSLGRPEGGQTKVEKRHQNIQKYIASIIADKQCATKEAIRAKFPAGEEPSHSTLHNDLTHLTSNNRIKQEKMDEKKEGRKGFHFTLVSE